MSKSLLSFIILASLGTIFLPRNVSAAEMTFIQYSQNDKTNIVEVHIDPKGKSLNVAEGVLKIQSSDDVKIEILSDKSVFSIWPNPAVYYPEDKTIRFTGGTPQGFSQDSLIFNLHIITPLVSSTTLIWTGGSAYLNDGKGSPEIIFAKPFTLDPHAKLSTPGIDMQNVIIIALISVAVLSIVLYVFKKK